LYPRLLKAACTIASYELPVVVSLDMVSTVQETLSCARNLGLKRRKALDSGWNQQTQEGTMNTGESLPIPQANDLAVLATVVDAVADGCVTDTSIAEAIGMSGRQGGYYPNAAASLGLIEATGASGEREWQLTPAGATFVGLGALERCNQLSDAILESEEVQTYCEEYFDHGEYAVRKKMEDRGVSAATAARRASTIGTWVDWAMSSSDDQIAKVGAAMTGTRTRAPGVGKALAATRRRSTVTHRLCENCFVQLPTGLDGTLCESCC
jgi:hypothetical protein